MNALSKLAAALREIGHTDAELNGSAPDVTAADADDVHFPGRTTPAGRLIAHLRDELQTARKSLAATTERALWAEARCIVLRGLIERQKREIATLTADPKARKKQAEKLKAKARRAQRKKAAAETSTEKDQHEQ
jgi:hypothetical protein